MTQKSKLIGSLPKIGIRPTIDGRLGGVRESLEDQTMRMAQSVADLIQSKLRHITGEPVECVIADSCIGGVSESAACADKFAREGVGASITVTPCWCYGSETMDMDPLIPKAVWGFNGTERPGAVYLAAMQAAHNQKGLPIFTIYGRDVQDAGDTEIPADVQEKMLRFANAALAVAMMKGKSYLGMGGVSMGIMGSYTDHEFFESYLGMRVEAVDMVEFVRRMERGIYDVEEFEMALEWVMANCKQGEDYNSEKDKFSDDEIQSMWETSVKMTLIARDLMVGNPRLKDLGFGEEAQGHNALAAGFQGQRQWTDHLPNGDFMEAMLTTSFDWNGKRAPYMLATENDTLNAVSMLFGHLITKGAQIFADVRTYWSPEAVKRVTGHTLEGRAAGGFLHLINSGPAALDGTGQQSDNGVPAMKPHWEISDEEQKACLDATTWHPGIREYFRGGGLSTRFRTKGGMPVTLCRVNLTRGLGPALQIAQGWSVELPENVHDVLDNRTNPTWPTTWFVPETEGDGVFRDVYSVMNAWGSNHGAFAYGHIGADLITLAAMLRIPVYMHNVAKDQIFRPSAWNTFGTAELESADFRACQAFGPLYG
ncbi:MAG: L-fucose isomerase [Verrucomicrobia bacterium]|nr:L-fucose isomerase [Verrucomicrobiota bacterium]MCH8512518.1 L-fucose isomerase [Kiritimatiellia bacterium]